MININLVPSSASYTYMSLDETLQRLFNSYIFTMLTESNRQRIQADLDHISDHFREKLNGGKLTASFGYETVTVLLLPDVNQCNKNNNLILQTMEKKPSLQKKWREKQSAYYESHREEWNTYQREYKRKRYSEDPEYRQKTIEYSRQWHQKQLQKNG